MFPYFLPNDSVLSSHKQVSLGVSLKECFVTFFSLRRLMNNFRSVLILNMNGDASGLYLHNLEYRNIG